jgi:predicted RecA/RadA family phage recombinase
MAQDFQAAFVQKGQIIDYVPSVAVHAGDVYQEGSVVGVACESIAAGELGHLCISCVVDLVKINGAINIGAPLYWAATGNPQGGSAGTGACQTSASTYPRIGFAAAAATDTAEVVRTLIVPGSHTSFAVTESASRYIADPGDAGTLSASNIGTVGGFVKLASTAAETRTLEAPTSVGVVLVLCMIQDGGTITVSCATAFKHPSSAAYVDIAFNDVGDTVVLCSVYITTNTYAWAVWGNDGASFA